MPEARVTDVAALADFRSALASFALEARQALDEVQLETRRALDWITHDRPAHWRAEIRRSTDAVARAKDELSQTRTFKRIGEYVPSCAEEKKLLEMAKRRMEHAEQKLETVKQWGRTAQQAVDEFKGPVQKLMAVLDCDIPHAMTVLDRMSDALTRYAALGAPGAIQWEDLVGNKADPSAARPENELEQVEPSSEKRAEDKSAQNTETAAP